MIITKQPQSNGDHLYICQCLKYERFIPKTAGFKWDSYSKVWKTNKRSNAARLREFADSTCTEELAKVRIHQSSIDKIEAAFIDVYAAKDEYEKEQAVKETRRLEILALEPERELLKSTIPEGNYIIDDQGSPLIIHVKISQFGYQYVSTGPEKTYRGCDVRLLRLLGTTDLHAAELRYAKETGRCYKCNRELKDGVSIWLGIGPECGEVEHAAYKSGSINS